MQGGSQHDKGISHDFMVVTSLPITMRLDTTNQKEKSLAIPHVFELYIPISECLVSHQYHMWWFWYLYTLIIEPDQWQIGELKHNSPTAATANGHSSSYKAREEIPCCTVPQFQSKEIDFVWKTLRGACKSHKIQETLFKFRFRGKWRLWWFFFWIMEPEERLGGTPNGPLRWSKYPRFERFRSR